MFFSLQCYEVFRDYTPWASFIDLGLWQFFLVGIFRGSTKGLIILHIYEADGYAADGIVFLETLTPCLSSEEFESRCGARRITCRMTVEGSEGCYLVTILHLLMLCL